MKIEKKFSIIERILCVRACVCVCLYVFCFPTFIIFKTRSESIFINWFCLIDVRVKEESQRKSPQEKIEVVWRVVFWHLAVERLFTCVFACIFVTENALWKCHEANSDFVMDLFSVLYKWNYCRVTARWSIFDTWGGAQGNSPGDSTGVQEISQKMVWAHTHTHNTPSSFGESQLPF